MRTARLWTVKNSAGQALGTYRRFTAREAIAALLHDNGVYNSQFRGGVVLQFANLRAEEVKK